MLYVASSLLSSQLLDRPDVETAIRVGDGFALLIEFYYAQRNMEQILTANNNNVDAVLAENDGMAGGVIAALEAQGLAIPVSGQDGDHAALNRVARGTQLVSVWKDARQLGAAAGSIAAALASGTAMADIDGAVKWSGGANGVEMDAIFLAPTPISASNINVVIEAGHIGKDKVCAGAMAGVTGC